MTRARETSENARQAKAWANFNGTFGSSPLTLDNGGIRDAFNVSSVTYHGVGVYTINFATPMANTNYCLVAFGRDPSNDSTVVNNIGSMASDTKTISSFVVRYTYHGVYYNSSEINVIVFGE